MTTPVNPVARLTPEKRKQRLNDSIAKGRTVCELLRHPGEYLVTSSTYPNGPYRVIYDTEHKRYSCECKWWNAKQAACGHLVHVSWYVAKKKKGAPIAKAQ